MERGICPIAVFYFALKHALSLTFKNVIGWHHSIALPRKPPIGRKHLRDISYTSRVIADLVPNFVAMATGVGRCKILLTPFDSPTPKTLYQTQISKRYLLYEPSYSRFFPKFRCRGNGVWS